jgi:hypothetical protein
MPTPAGRPAAAINAISPAGPGPCVSTGERRLVCVAETVPVRAARQGWARWDHPHPLVGEPTARIFACRSIRDPACKTETCAFGPGALAGKPFSSSDNLCCHSQRARDRSSCVLRQWQVVLVPTPCSAVLAMHLRPAGRPVLLPHRKVEINRTFSTGCSA